MAVHSSCISVVDWANDSYAVKQAVLHPAEQAIFSKGLCIKGSKLELGSIVSYFRQQYNKLKSTCFNLFYLRIFEQHGERIECCRQLQVCVDRKNITKTRTAGSVHHKYQVSANLKVPKNRGAESGVRSSRFTLTLQNEFPGRDIMACEALDG